MGQSSCTEVMLMIRPPPPWAIICRAASWVPKNALFRLMSSTLAYCSSVVSSTEVRDLADVGLDPDHLVTEVAHLLLEVLGGLLVGDVVDDDVGTVCGQGQHDRLADAGVATGDHCHLALQRHVGSLPLESQPPNDPVPTYPYLPANPEATSGYGRVFCESAQRGPMPRSTSGPGDGTGLPGTPTGCPLLPPRWQSTGRHNPGLVARAKVGAGQPARHSGESDGAARSGAGCRQPDGPTRPPPSTGDVRCGICPPSIIQPCSFSAREAPPPRRAPSPPGSMDARVCTGCWPPPPWLPRVRPCSPRPQLPGPPAPPRWRPSRIPTWRWETPLPQAQPCRPSSGRIRAPARRAHACARPTITPPLPPGPSAWI